MSENGTAETTDTAAAAHGVDEQVQTDVVPNGNQFVDPNQNVHTADEIARALVVDEASVLIRDYLHCRLHQANLVWVNSPPSPIEPTRLCLVMRTLGDEFERRYADVYQNMMITLQITPTTAYPTFLSVASELFRGNGNELMIKWGRIVALYAFAGALAVHCVRLEMPEQVNNIAEWVVTFVQNNLAQWISANGGWVRCFFGALPEINIQPYRSFRTDSCNSTRKETPTKDGPRSRKS